MNEETAVTVIEQEQQGTIALANELKALTVTNAAEYEFAQKMIERSAEYEKRWDELTGPAKKAAYDSYQKSLRLHDDPITELKSARGKAKQECLKWADEQERIRREEQLRLEEIARKQAEEEQIAAALEAQAEGDSETANAIIAQPVYVPPVNVPKPAVQASRLTAGRSVWSAEVLDLMALVKAVAAGTAPITFIEPNMVNLNAQARASKQATKVPGVRAIEKRV